MITDLNLTVLTPEIFLSITAMGLVLVGAFMGNGSTRVISFYAFLALLVSGALILSFSWQPQIIFNGLFVFDSFAATAKLLLIIGLLMTVLLAPRYLEQNGMLCFEYPVLMLLAAVGMMVMVSANNFMTLYLGLELQSLALYVLAAMRRSSLKSAEAGIKYFILGALSSGLLLFGISLIYGKTGSLDFGIIAVTLVTADAMSSGLMVGLVFILAGMAFKVSAAPFHMWTPDVYQGAPTSVTAFFAIVPKLAAMAILMRMLFGPFELMVDQWQQILVLMSVLSMLIGSFGGIAQTNLKRLLAYSSIGNMGYALIGLVLHTAEGAAATLLYMLIYMITLGGVFAVLLAMRRDDIHHDNISDFSGLSKTNPGLAYAMAALMFSMAGIPPLAGFFGKFVIFKSAMAAGYEVLAVIGVLTSVVSAYYYLKLIKVMFFEDSDQDALDSDMGVSGKIVLAASLIFAFTFILNPLFFIEQTAQAVMVLFPN